MVLHKNRDALNWDTEPCEQADLSDISIPKIKAFAAASGLKYDSLRNVLVKLKLLSGSKPRNAAVLLFGKKPEDIFFNARLQCAVFSGTDTAYITDMKDYYGDAFYLIEKAQEYILEKINIGMRIEGLRRIDVPEIDREAFREAIINAFCHRDYREPDSVNVAVLKDRVEIRSQGLLYGGLTIQQIRTKLVSERRNELIADMFHRIHFVERWGRGIKLILDKEPTAEFMEIGTHFITVFKRKAQTVEKASEGLNEGLKTLWQAVNNHPGIKAKDLSIALKDRPIKTIERQIKVLVNAKLIERRGSRKSGGYYVIEKNP